MAEADKELIEIKTIKAEEIFTIEKVGTVIDMVKEKVRQFVPDMATPEGMDEIKRMARRVSSSKTALDNLGKELVSEWKSKSKIVDAARKKICDELDILRDQVRLPMTEFEQKETKRIEAHGKNLENINAMACAMPQSSQEYERLILILETMVIDSSWEEFEISGKKARDSALPILKDRLDLAKKNEAQKEELEKLRKEKEAMLKAEHERKIAEEAAAKAQKAAEDKARADIERADREKFEAERKLRQAEQDKATALEKQKQEFEQKKAQEEAEAKRKEEAAKIVADDILAKKKAASENLEHQRAINSNIVAALMGYCKIDKEVARDIVTVIALKKIPNVTIQY